MKRYFIPLRDDVSWSMYFKNDLTKQGWRGEIIDETPDGYHLKRTDGIGDHWYVKKNWGKVVDEEIFKIDDKLFEL